MRRSAISSGKRCSSPRAQRPEGLIGGGLIGAAFRHRTSRAGDPQLHTHVVVTNATLAADGGGRRWTAGTCTGTHARPGFYQAELRHALPPVWLAWEPTLKGIGEVIGVLARCGGSSFAGGPDRSRWTRGGMMRGGGGGVPDQTGEDHRRRRAATLADWVDGPTSTASIPACGSRMSGHRRCLRDCATLPTCLSARLAELTRGPRPSTGGTLTRWRNARQARPSPCSRSRPSSSWRAGGSWRSGSADSGVSTRPRAARDRRPSPRPRPAPANTKRRGGARTGGDTDRGAGISDEQRAMVETLTTDGAGSRSWSARPGPARPTRWGRTGSVGTRRLTGNRLCARGPGRRQLQDHAGIPS